MISFPNEKHSSAVDQITGGLFGRQPNHDPQPVPRRDVEKRAGRYGMRDAHGIDAERCHLREVLLDQPVVGIFTTALIRAESAISDAAHKKDFAVRGQKLAVDKCPTCEGRNETGDRVISLSKFGFEVRVS